MTTTPKPRKLPRKVKAVSLAEHDHIVAALTDEMEMLSRIVNDVNWISETAWGRK